MAVGFEAFERGADALRHVGIDRDRVRFPHIPERFDADAGLGREHFVIGTKREPPVVVGLVVAMTLWRSGPLGDLQLIYTPIAIIIAQTIIAAPVVTGLSAAALATLDPRLQQQLLGLGASRVQMIWYLWREARLPLLAALMAGFGSIISEVGASMMVGGNIRGQTRVLTTAIVLETSKEIGRAHV